MTIHPMVRRIAGRVGALSADLHETAPVASAQTITPVRRTVRVLAAVTILVALAYPVRAFLLDSNTYLIVKIVWGAALIGASWFAALRAPLLCIVVPLVPLLPHVWMGVPHGIVHLAVLSQALPLLAGIAVGRQDTDRDEALPPYALLITIALTSVATFYFAYRLTFPSTLDFARELHAHLSRYVFWPLSSDVENMLVALTTFGDGLLAYLVVRRSATYLAPGTLGRIMATGVVIVAVVGLWQGWTGVGLRTMWMMHDPGITRINATFADPNALASYFALTAPIVAAVALGQRGHSRAVGLAGLTIVLAALVMTGGRMGYFATAIGLIVLAVRALRSGLPGRNVTPGAYQQLRRRLIGAVVVLLCVVLVLTAVGTAGNFRHADQTSYVRTLLYTFNLRQPLDEIFKGRLAIWRTVILMVREHPVFGIGAGMMYRQFPSYHRVFGDFAPNVRLSAHNTFLNIAGELGMVGLFSWLLLLGVVFVVAFRRSQIGEHPVRRWMRHGLAAGLVASAVTMLTGDRTVLREDVVLFSSAIAITAAMAPSRPRLSRRVRSVALVVIALLVVTWPIRAVHGARQIQFDRIAWGFHPVETDGDGQTIRWTTERAVFHVPTSAKVLVLPLRSVAPFAQTVTITMDGVLADRLMLTDDGWRQVRYVLPATRDRARYFRIELHVEPTWQRAHDPRRLGIVVGKYEWGR